ncbi:LLM class flavin-dependent oxidoreductase [Rhodococcoides yunnanense]|uniref:LLM class flavin-dependent oxidoreductase n=1 Tax=Rhodococcoides yunnanense TaxID=278209 RepID=UPI0009352C8C|nr:LLM class flavin-dependent oxidoreductase [Rhodococcus yunnanensis]
MTRSTRWLLAITDRLVNVLHSDGELADRIDDAGFDTVIFGIDRLTPHPANGDHLDPTAVASILSQRITKTRIAIAAANQREHPWNLARAVASLQTFALAGSGLLLGPVDHTAGSGEPGMSAWDARGLSQSVDTSVAATIDTGAIARTLWNDYSFDAVVSDRTSGRYIDPDRIRSSNHRGVYEVAGPLSVPTRGRPTLSLFAVDDIFSALPSELVVPAAFDSVTTTLESATARVKDPGSFGGRPLIVHIDDLNALTHARTLDGSNGRIHGLQIQVSDRGELEEALAQFH